MKSIRLSQAIRDDISRAMLEAWEKNKPAPYDIHEEELKLGDALYAASYPNLNTGNVPVEMLYKSPSISISINNEFESYRMREERPVRMQNRYNQIPNKNYRSKPQIIKTYEQQKDACEMWRKERQEFVSEVVQILSSVNTTKQLVEIWPEADQYLPPFASDPSRGINLPALKTSRLNAALGITGK